MERQDGSEQEGKFCEADMMRESGGFCKSNVTCRRRMKGILALFLAVLTALTLRLFAVQLVKGETYRALAEENQRILLTGISERGTIFDRDGTPLTGREEVRFVFLEKRLLDERAEALLQEAGAEEISRESRLYRVYLVRKEKWQAEGLPESVERLQKEYGAFVLQGTERYGEEPAVPHLIGTVGETTGRGESGLEALYEGVLSAGNRQYFVTGDSAGYILAGIPVEAEGDPLASGIVTTLDSALQQQLEELLLGYGVTWGAALVSDVATGELLAWAVQPGCTPEEAESMGGEAGSLEPALVQTGLRAAEETGEATALQALRLLGILGNRGIDRGLSLVKGILQDSVAAVVPAEEPQPALEAAAAAEFAAALDLADPGLFCEGPWGLALAPQAVPRYGVVILLQKGKDPLPLLQEVLSVLEDRQ